MQPNSTSRTESRRRRERRAGHVSRFRQSGRPAAEEGTGGVRLPAVPREDEAAADTRRREGSSVREKKIEPVCCVIGGSGG
jgi:hypothetical protein